MSFQLFSRRRLFGRLFGGAAVLFGAGRSVVAAPIAEPTATPPLEGVMYYSYDECGRLVGQLNGTGPILFGTLSAPRRTLELGMPFAPRPCNNGRVCHSDRVERQWLTKNAKRSQRGTLPG